MPVTVLELKPEEQHSGPDEKAAERVKTSSEEAVARAQESDETRDSTIHVETRTEPADLAKAIAAEVEKGHDLLYLGVEPLAASEGGYVGRAKLALDAFKQSAVLVTARGSLNRKPDTALRILVPVTGDTRSMRAIELASLLAKSTDATVAAIYVRAGEDAGERPSASMEAIFERVREIGRHYDIDIRTTTGGSGNRELSILTQARRGRYNLIVLGVGRRAGDTLSFGSLADTLLESSDRSLAFFVTS
jgi:nucleotide-binding universal stress UspA family protein